MVSVIMLTYDRLMYLVTGLQSQFLPRKRNTDAGKDGVSCAIKASGEIKSWA